MKSSQKCPCGINRGKDPSCDMCDGHANDPDTGWGGYTNHFTGKHYSSKEEEIKDTQYSGGFDMEDFDSDEID